MGGRGIVCIDISGDRLSAIEVRRNRIAAWTLLDLPPGQMRSGDPIDPDGLGSKVRYALAAAGIESKRARLTISDEAAVTRVIRLPRIARRHLEGAVRYAAERELPFSLEKASWSWHLVASQPDGVVVRLVAAWREVVQRITDLASAADLVAEVVEPRSTALQRALGVDDAILLETGERTIDLTVLWEAEGPFVEQVVLMEDGEDWRKVVDRLVTKGVRRHSSTSTRAGLAPVVLAGDLDDSALHLAAPTRAASEMLNGHPPVRPDDLPSAKLLAVIGLAMR